MNKSNQQAVGAKSNDERGSAHARRQSLHPSSFILHPFIIVVIATTFTHCKREERGFRVEAPAAGRTVTTRMSDLQPGRYVPPAHVKNEYEENAYAMSEGKRLFTQFNCVGCHANGGGGIGPPLIDGKWLYGGAPEQVFSTIVEGRPNGMPSFGGKVPDYQIWQLVAYVRSMSGQVPKTAAPARNDDMQVMPPENSKDREPMKNSSLPKSAEMPQ